MKNHRGSLYGIDFYPDFKYNINVNKIFGAFQEYRISGGFMQ